MQGVSRTPARANHQPAEFERFRHGDHRRVGMASRPRGSIVPVWEKKDVVAEARHRLENVRLKGVCTREKKRHHGASRVDLLHSVRGDFQVNADSATWCGRIYLGLVVEDTGEKETVPRAPGVQRPAVDPEPVRHLPDSEATKADDPAVVVRISKGLEIRVTKQLVDVVGRNIERFGEAESQNGLTTCELAIDLEPQASFLISHCREPGEQLGGEGAQGAHAAQHDSFATSFVNACAASMSLSDRVK